MQYKYRAVAHLQQENTEASAYGATMEYLHGCDSEAGRGRGRTARPRVQEQPWHKDITSTQQRVQ